MSIELLSPAGDLERLEIAIKYGADAVYFGGKQFSLRARASNFDLNDIKNAVDFIHKHHKKAYVTVNMIPHNEDFIGLKEYLKTLESFGVDAIICASLAILKLAKEVAPKMEVHISTQQTTTNHKAIEFWQKNGADRIVLAREVTLDELAEIKKISSLPIEVFIHGGMCANYSGRCVISNMLTNRDANRGGCAQSCRWNYHLYHGEDLLDRKDYLLSLGSKDMCAASVLNDLLMLDVASLKIEGRMKTGYYIANVVKGYRLMIDSYEKNGSIISQDYQTAMKYINRVANRDTFPGFYNGCFKNEGQIYNTPTTVLQSYVANVIYYEDGIATIVVRNHFEKGDILAVMNPTGNDVNFSVEKMLDENGEEVVVANKPMQILKIKVPVYVDKYSFIKHGERK